MKIGRDAKVTIAPSRTIQFPWLNEGTDTAGTAKGSSLSRGAHCYVLDEKIHQYTFIPKEEERVAAQWKKTSLLLLCS